MVNVIVLHGKNDQWENYDPSFPLISESDWYSWLTKQLLMKDVEVHKPSVYRAFEATYEDWRTEVERYPINEETICVGHSCGGGFWLRWLSENKDRKLKKLVLVAPWFDPLKFMPENFGFDLFEFERDPDLLSRVQDCVVFNSDDDQESVQLTIEEIREVWPAMEIREFHNYGHFCERHLGSKEFPELLNEVLKSV